MTERNIAVIGAGAVVVSDVSDHALMVGNVARQKRWVCQCAERLTSKLKCPACKNGFEKGPDGLVPKNNLKQVMSK
jgi:hypothetical protein